MNRTKVIGLALAAAFFLPNSFLTAPRKEGQAWAWGFGRNGELGNGSESNTSLPQLIKNINFIDIDSKKSLSAGITSEGKLFTWGKNRNGVLGHLPGNLNVLIPRLVEVTDKINQVSCGYQTMCAVT
jgi:alpha-tubulin suppressor-like RCC1 family protein